MNKFLKLLLGASLLATCSLPVNAQNIGAEYQSGDMVFFDKDTGNYVLKLQQTLADVKSLKVNGTALSATATEMNLLAGVVAGTASASKAAVLGANKNLDTLVIAAGGLKIGAGAGTAVDSTADELDQYAVQTYFADAGNASSAYVVVPHAGTIKSIAVVNFATNATTATVFTGAINGTPITHPTLQEGVAAAAGTAVSVVPTAANVVAAGDVLSIASDGGTDASVPVMVTVTIER